MAGEPVARVASEPPSAPTGITNTGREAGVATTPPTRVMVWGENDVPLLHDGVGPVDLQQEASYERLLVRSLMRAQVGLSLMCLVLAVILTASFPVIAAILPAVHRAKILGLPLTLVVLGVGMCPVLLLIGWFYDCQAGKLERRFIDLVEPAKRRRFDD